ncbi:DnaJ domain-containing protein [Paenibacillus sp. SYP-B3998]|uniref:DnaJ domain-containing protein n=1 Tax=Paenibacillus sp. SYP-B3998 TaxID=2678564 RepID=A0A6G4A5Y1_9BACL|nr:DnaJ domain-containing protein [Paenibacillus sp. SYP-B3998]NEW09805.1 DnaJ domain-containing protein [Paenibacillus sp. SYP-B3998]
MRTYYEMLEIDPVATPDEIKKAYKRMAKKHHPDANAGSKQSEMMFKLVNEAYHTLSDAAARAAYDARMAARREQQAHPNSASGSKARGEQAEKASSQFNRTEMEKTFDRFFGFHPKSQDSGMKSNQQANKMDTTKVFESYFGIQRK